MPQLTEAQTAVAKALGVTEQQYQEAAESLARHKQKAKQKAIAIKLSPAQQRLLIRGGNGTSATENAMIRKGLFHRYRGRLLRTFLGDIMREQLLSQADTDTATRRTTTSTNG